MNGSRFPCHSVGGGIFGGATIGEAVSSTTPLSSPGSMRARSSGRIWPTGFRRSTGGAASRVRPDARSARMGDAGNLVVFHDGAVTVLVLERFDPDAAHVVCDRIAIDEDGTVATLIDVCRSAAGGGDVRLTVGYNGSRQGIRVAGFQHEAVAA